MSEELFKQATDLAAQMIRNGVKGSVKVPAEVLVWATKYAYYNLAMHYENIRLKQRIEVLEREIDSWGMAHQNVVASGNEKDKKIEALLAASKPETAEEDAIRAAGIAVVCIYCD